MDLVSANRRDPGRKLFEVLVRENEGALLAFLRTMVRDPGLVDDLFQETLITAWRRFDQFDSTRPLGPWLRGIALNLTRNAKRRQQRMPITADPAWAEAAEATIGRMESVAADTWDEKLRTLNECVQQLAGGSQQLIQQRYQQRLSSLQIAETCGRTPAAIRKHLQRIRKALAQCVQTALAETPA